METIKVSNFRTLCLRIFHVAKTKTLLPIGESYTGQMDGQQCGSLPKHQKIQRFDCHITLGQNFTPPMQMFLAVNGILLKYPRGDALRFFGEVCEDDCTSACMDPHEAEDVFVLSWDDFQLAACESLMLFSQIRSAFCNP